MPLESPTARDGDAGFIGFASRLNPVALPAGVLQLSENMRLDRGTASTRKGAMRLADDLLPGDFPLTVPFRFDPVENTAQTVLPFTLGIGSSGAQVLNTYSNGVFASGAYRSPGLNNKEYILLATGTGAWIYDDTDSLGEPTSIITDHTGDPITDHSGNDLEAINFLQPLPFPAGETIEPTDSVSMVQAFDRMYLLRSADQNVAGWEEKIMTGGVGASGTTGTVYCAGHGYSAGQRVRLEGSSVAAFDGHEYDIVSTTNDSFTITVPDGTASDAGAPGSKTVRRVKPPLYWTGDITVGFAKAPGGVPDEGPSFRQMRSVPWATYANNRLILPDGRDQVMLSDILDPDLYDPFWASFRANQGSNDYIVAVHPWVEGAFLVFMRNSIWLATVNQFASVDGTGAAIDTPVSKLELLTDEVGCSARQTIQTAGQYVYFLSDAGVYRLDARLDLKLRGDTLPLSDPINDQIARINTGAPTAVGLWHDNRYYLAAAVDGADFNNALFIYSALNEQWETIDSYPFGLTNLIVAQRNAAKRRIFAASLTGKLFLLDELARGDDPPDSTLGIDFFTPVPGRLRTRRYGFGTMGSKRFVRVMSDVVLPDEGSIKVSAIMVNPDREIELVPGKTNTSGLAEDYTLKQPIRQKAHYCEIEFETTAERPEIRTVGVEAAMPSRPQTETRHSE